MNRKIQTIKGDNPSAILIEDGKVTVILDEEKIDPLSKSDYPTKSVGILKELIQDNKIIPQEYRGEHELLDIEGTCYGLAYSNKYVYEVVRQNGLYYEQHIHDPKDLKFSTPDKFFKSVAGLVEKGFKVGWFQGKWSVGDVLDLNRCVLKYDCGSYGKETIDRDYLAKFPLFRRVVSTGCLFSSIQNLHAYNPNQAIKKLKDKEIDVLVMNNMIVANKRGDIRE